MSKISFVVARCMAISAAVFVGGIEPWKDALLSRAKALNVGPGAASSTDVGPLITPEARDRAANLIQSGVDQVFSLHALPSKDRKVLC
jgi:malonate-semialdehyde dehydrogenase (acetylating)/methylmalonate-semialdehyde dehydrogenase